jgi:hypothetical protein
MIEHNGLELILLKYILERFKPLLIKIHYIYLLYNERLELKELLLKR